MLEQIHQPPQAQPPRSRWTLALLQRLCAALQKLRSLSGVWRRLRKWRLAWKQGRQHITSPDPNYATKLEAIQQALQQAREHPEALSVLYADETTCYRQPKAARCWHAQGAGGAHQPTAPTSPTRNTIRRIVGSLDAVTGRGLYRANSKIGVWQLCAFLKQVRKAYGPTRRLILIWDNWPIHRYDNVLATAQEQRLELLFLPTYAPWTNPIEKLWKKLKEEILAMHRLSQRWAELKEQVHSFLRSYDRDAPDLLRYVGLAKLAD